MKRMVIVVLAMGVAATACSSGKTHSNTGSTPAVSAGAASTSTVVQANTPPTSATAADASAAGSLMISGAVTATIAEEPASSGNVRCGPSGVGTVNGQIAFGPQGAGGYLLSVTGGPGSFTLPLASGPSVLLVQTGGTGRWGGLNAPASGTFSMQGTAAGSIHGTVNATLISLVSGTSTQVHVTGTWTC